MDQVQFFQLRTDLLSGSAYWCMTTRRLIIQWSRKILVIDIIISWKLFWDQSPQTTYITWMEYENNTFPIKENPCLRVAHVRPWRQITKSPNTNSTNRSSNHMPSKVWFDITYPIPKLQWCNRCSSRMGKLFCPTLYDRYDYLSIGQTTRIYQTLPIWIQFGIFC